MVAESTSYLWYKEHINLSRGGCCRLYPIPVQLLWNSLNLMPYPLHCFKIYMWEFHPLPCPSLRICWLDDRRIQELSSLTLSSLRYYIRPFPPNTEMYLFCCISCPWTMPQLHVLFFPRTLNCEQLKCYRYAPHVSFLLLISLQAEESPHNESSTNF